MTSFSENDQKLQEPVRFLKRDLKLMKDAIVIFLQRIKIRKIRNRKWTLNYSLTPFFLSPKDAIEDNSEKKSI